MIPIVPTIGGSTEFVPSEYQYHSIQEAADIISNILNHDEYFSAVVRSLEISKRVSMFSIQNYKRNLNNIIDAIKSNEVEAVVLNKTQTKNPH